MATETFFFDTDAGAAVYYRLWNLAGEVFDFADGTFQALAGATTPQVAATERADMNGTGRSGYTAAVNLSGVNATGAARRYVLKAYQNAVPAAGDVAVSDDMPLVVQFGELVESELPVFVQAEVSVLTTAGNQAHVALWLEFRGELVDLSGATCSVTLREMGGGVNQFTLTEADKAGATAILANRFELIKTTPGFTADRQYAIDAAITLNGVTFTSPDSTVVIG